MKYQLQASLVTARAEPEIRLSVLGPTRIERKGRLVELGDNFDAYALLCLLASKLGRPMSVVAVSETLWAAANDEQAYERLLAAMMRVSRCFRAAKDRVPFVLKNGTIRLNVGDYIWLDANELVAATDSSDALRRKRALGLLRGQPFADFPYDSWTLLPREYLRDVYVRLTQEEAEKAIEAGNLLHAADLLAAALDIEPYEEDIYTAAMAVNCELGRVSVAVRQARRCRNMLAGLGLAPSMVFEAMEQQLEPYKAVVSDRFV